LPRLVKGMGRMAQMLRMHLLLLLRMMELIRHNLLQGGKHHLRA
jgi:hypothetical protein